MSHFENGLNSNSEPSGDEIEYLDELSVELMMKASRKQKECEIKPVQGGNEQLHFSPGPFSKEANNWKSETCE